MEAAVPEVAEEVAAGGPIRAEAGDFSLRSEFCGSGLISEVAETDSRIFFGAAVREE